MSASRLFVVVVALALLDTSAPRCAAQTGVGSSDRDKIRAPAVAGRFYPASADTLRRAVRSLLDGAVEPKVDDPVAIVAPHAGYVYSGQIAADAFRQVEGREYDLVVILGANHTTAGFDAIAPYWGRGFRTPLGVAPIDQALAPLVAAADADARRTRHDAAGDDGVHAGEHSIEVQVPFVQVLFPKARIVPIVVGTEDPEVVSRFGQALARAVDGRRVLIVASSDLSHYPDAATAARVDAEMLDAIATLDVAAARRVADRIVSRRLPQLATAACGLAPVMAAMAASKALGASRGVVVSYANSSQVAVGERARVVGYGAVVFAREETGAREGSEPERAAPAVAGGTAGERGDALVTLARDTIQRFLESETLPLLREPADGPVEAGPGAFVTLRKRGELRGCIGRLVSDEPLEALVSRVAFDAAFRDPRFPPLSPRELTGLDVEVSVLSPPRRVPTPESIIVGRHGVVLRKAGRSAVFLPSVATDEGWDRAELLDQLCVKAGLALRCWTQGAELEVFEAEVFHGADRR